MTNTDDIKFVISLNSACMGFIECVEATGGVRCDDDGCYYPLGDPAWFDLGLAYVRACGVLGRVPMIDNSSNEYSP